MAGHWLCHAYCSKQYCIIWAEKPICRVVLFHDRIWKTKGARVSAQTISNHNMRLHIFASNQCWSWELFTHKPYWRTALWGCSSPGNEQWTCKPQSMPINRMAPWSRQAIWLFEGSGALCMCYTSLNNNLSERGYNDPPKETGRAWHIMGITLYYFHQTWNRSNDIWPNNVCEE